MSREARPHHGFDRRAQGGLSMSAALG